MDTPIMREWSNDVAQMLHDAQMAEYIVAQIDGRPPREARISVSEDRESVRVILVEGP